MKKEYQYDEDSVKAIIEWAQSAILPKDVTLSSTEHIFDTSLYVRANLDITEVSYSFYPDTGNKSPFHGNLFRQTGNKTHSPRNYA